MEAATDTAAMREQAALVRSAAESIRVTIEQLGHQAPVFEGPAAERMREANGQRVARTRQVVSDLEGLAERMLGEAAHADERGAGGHGLYQG